MPNKSGSFTSARVFLDDTFSLKMFFITAMFVTVQFPISG
jgi:hypothetical protein